MGERILNWIERGHGTLTKDKWELWDRIVPIRANDLYGGMELDACLDIIDVLNEDSDMARAKLTIENQNHSGMSFGLVCSMMKAFHEKGEEFVEFVR